MKLYYKLRSRFCQWANTKLGWRLTRHTPDRVWLERFVKANCCGQKVLSVGTAWYTMHLPEIAKAKSWVTIDKSPAAATFGTTSDVHYTVDLCQPDTDLAGYLNMFDIVIVNGVLGWGVDTQAEADVIMTKLSSYLMSGGTMLVGYNSNRIDWLPTATSTQLYEWEVADRKSMHTYQIRTKD
jgi:hypothetical protein